MTKITGTTKLIVGGWMWWVSSWRSANPLLTPNYRYLMHQYGRGVKWEDAVNEQH